MYTSFCDSQVPCDSQVRPFVCGKLGTNSTKVVHTNSTQVVHMNSTQVVHMNSVHGKIVTHSGPQTVHVSPVLHAVALVVGVAVIAGAVSEGYHCYSYYFIVVHGKVVTHSGYSSTW